MSPAPSDSPRPWDVVVFGATGFVGRLIAAYLADHAPKHARVAIAGRDARRLAALQGTLRREVGSILADVDDHDSLARMAAQARVVLSTVGPYMRYGEPVVRACVAQGADYLDLTGEPAFVDAITRAHDAEARARGVLVVPCCGFDSIPADLGVLYTVRQLPRDRPIAIDGFFEGRASFSGGTFASALGVLAEPARKARPARDPDRPRQPRPRLHYHARLRRWVMPMPTIDPQIVRTSAALRGDYGDDFRYGHYVAMPTLLHTGAAIAGAGLFAGLARLPPARALLTRLRPPGSGPSEDVRARSWFKLTFFGRAGDAEVVTEVSGGDPGYDETARMSGETALCFALQRDALPGRGGVSTTAAAGGDPLLARLQAAGLSFRVLERRGC